MKFYTLTFILVATVCVVTLADPEPEPAKASRYRAAQMIDEAKATADAIDNSQRETEVVDGSDDSTKKGDASSGRLFMRKFLLFKNMFGNNQKQPVIPIIITGGAGTSGTSPTSTVTSSVTIPSGSGTVTTTPATATTPTTTTTPTTPATPITPPLRKPSIAQQVIPRESYEDNSENESDAAYDEAGMVDEQTIAAALAAGAEEYVVTDQEIKGTSDAKASRGPASVNLRRRGAQKGQVVSVRVPPKYRRYFKNGQRVIVNKKNRPAKRRVTKKRVNRNRNKKNKNRNKNKRRRVVAV